MLIPLSVPRSARYFAQGSRGSAQDWRGSGLASDPIPVAVEVMGVRRQNPEVPVRDVRAIQVGRRRRDAKVGVRRIASSGRGRGASRPSRAAELTRGAIEVVGKRVAGCDHRGIRVCPATGDDRENSAVAVASNLKIVFVDEGTRSEAEAREVISGFRASGLVELRRVDEHEPDSQTIFDVERVSIDDSCHVALDAEAHRSRTRRRHGWWWRPVDGR